MRHVDTRRYDMLLRVRAFAHAHPALFPSSTIAGRALAEIVAAVEEFKGHAAGHESCRGSAREALVTKAAARERLRDDVDAIVRTARAMNLETPGTGDRFLRPIGTTDLALLNAARALARDAAALEETLARFNLPADFLEVLERDIATFEEARMRRAAGIGAHVSARVALETTLANAMRAVRLLDAAVPNQLRDARQTLASWTRARRVAPAPSPRRRAPTPARTVVVSQLPTATNGASADVSGHASIDRRRGTEGAPIGLSYAPAATWIAGSAPRAFPLWQRGTVGPERNRRQVLSPSTLVGGERTGARITSVSRSDLRFRAVADHSATIEH